MKSFFYNHNSFLAPFFRLPLWQQNISLMLIFVGLSLFPLWFYWQNNEQQIQLKTQIQQQTEQLQHQINIAKTLQQKAESQLLTPEVAHQLLPINQQIQQAEHTSLQILNAHWDFQQQPFLQLQLQSNFPKLQQFLTHLLQQNPKLQTLEMHLQKLEKNGSHSVLAEFLFQLAQEE